MCPVDRIVVFDNLNLPHATSRGTIWVQLCAGTIRVQLGTGTLWVQPSVGMILLLNSTGTIWAQLHGGAIWVQRNLTGQTLEWA